MELTIGLTLCREEHKVCLWNLSRGHKLQAGSRGKRCVLGIEPELLYDYDC